MIQREHIYETLREEILSCDLPIGAELREQELAARFGVSKSPVREALQRLVAEGLLSVIPRQGYRVSPISMTDVREIFAFRRVLELACVAQAIEDASDEQLRSLDRFRSPETTQARDFIAYNREFHAGIVRCCANERMVRTTCALLEEMGRLVLLSVTSVRDNNTARLVEEHCRVIDAMQERDRGKAVGILRKHLIAGERRALKALSWVTLKE